MSNGYEWYILAAYEGVLADYLDLYPADRVHVERDYSRLHMFVKSRGLTVFTVDLPAYAKHFDRCLADGLLTFSGLPLSRGKRGCAPIPRLFWGITRRVFDESGLLRSNPDIDAIRFLRQLYNTGKKFKVACNDSRTYDSVQEFFRIEEVLPSPTLNWGGDELDDIDPVDLRFYEDPGQTHSDDLFSTTENGNCEGESVRASLLSPCHTLHSVSDMIAAQLGFPTELRPKHGPGAVSDQRRFENKYLFPTWSNKLESVFPFSQYGFANEGLWADAVSQGLDGFVNHEPPSVLIAVPKTAKGPRLIAKEPIAHQWMQQALRDFFERRIPETALAGCIEFRSQDRSRMLALRASLTGDSWTVDLSSASDRMSLWLIERMFRRNKMLLSMLHATRTRWLINRIDKHAPLGVILKKFAPQGSACTFPLQSIVFSIISIACVLHSRSLTPSYRTIREAAKEVQVFGDDIVIPSDAGLLLTEMLHHLKLKVNTSKSYGTGKFRESCGMDAYDGHDVTPFYIRSFPKRSNPESVGSSIELVRNAFNKGFLKAAWHLRLLISSKIRYANLPEVLPDSGALGWPSRLGFDPNAQKCRWNHDLQRQEYLVPVLVSKSRTKPNEGSTGLLQYFTEAPSPDIVWKAGINQKPVQSIRNRWEPIQYFHNLEALA